MRYYDPLYSCIKLSDAPVISEDRVRAEINHVEKYSFPILILDRKGVKVMKARALGSG